MPIKKQNHRRIMQYLDQYGEVKANGIGKYGEEVQQLSACTREPLTVTDLASIAELAKQTAQQVQITASGKRIFIAFH